MQQSIIINGPAAKSIPLQEKVVSLLVNSQRKGSPTWIFIWQILLPWVGWTIHCRGSKGCVTSQEDASGFPPGDSTPSCPPQDGLDPSSMRPQPVRIIRPQIKLQLVQEKTRQTHDLQHRPLHPAEVNPPWPSHLMTMFKVFLWKIQIQDSPRHLHSVSPPPAYWRAAQPFRGLFWKCSFHLKSPDTALI